MELAQKLEHYFDRLWPINRSLTGNGNRETLKILSEIIPLNISEIPSGTKCFDWQVPPEWNVKEAWVKDSKGNEIINFKNNNLHLIGYSVPYQGVLELNQLKEHLYSLPNQPDLIPYLTSYYREYWGFCLTNNQLTKLQTGQYQVLIDSKLDPKGSMTIADLVIPGETKEEIMFSTYICHPSLANNELSGPLVTAFIYDAIKNKKLRYTYRFIFIPETIGSIYYLSKYGQHLKEKLVAGYVVTTVGDSGNFTYKLSRQKTSLADRATELILSQTEKSFNIEKFCPPDGSDDRQYCSPGFNLPVGSLMRTKYGNYKEYHTSGDNKNFINFSAMEQSVNKYIQVINLLENNYYYNNECPYGEPQLSKRDLYPTLSNRQEAQKEIEAIMWLLNMSDGNNDIISIAKESEINHQLLINSAKKLEQNKILKRL